MMISKDTLRQLMMHQRHEFMASCDKQELSRQFIISFESLKKNFPLPNSGVVAGFIPFNDEIDPQPLMKSLNNRPLQKLASVDKRQGDVGAQNRNVFDIHEDSSTTSTKQFASEVEVMKGANQGYDLALPWMRGNDMLFSRYTIGDPLLKNQFGFQQPEHFSAVIPDIILVPLLAFDQKGCRVGYGKGHYDRTLAQINLDKKIILIGLALPFMQCDNIPHEPHDQKLDAVLLPHSYIQER